MRLLGQGGIACIYLCEDTLAGTHVALKIPLPDMPEAAEAVRSEFAFGVTHRHPTLVTPIALDIADGSPVMVMPYIEGVAHAADATGGPFFGSHPECPPGPAIAAMLEVTAFVHFAGYVYNDFKPANFIFGTRPGESEAPLVRPHLIDFNLVSHEGLGPGKKGTMEYIAPEVLLGRPATPLSDCYSLGATLYELFTGRPPFVSSDGPGLIKLITESGSIDLRPVPEAFQEGLWKMLSRRPEERPRHMLEAARAMGVDGAFEEMLGENFGWYLAAGDPPFAEALRNAVAGYVRGRPEKAFLIRGLSTAAAELSYLTAQMGAAGWNIERIGSGFTEEAIARTLDHILAEECPDSQCRTLVLVDDFAVLSSANRQRLRGLLRPSKWHPVIISGRRWEACDLPCRIFNPTIECSPAAATREALRALLKQEPEFEFAILAAATGGHPEQVEHCLRSGARNGSFDIFSKNLTLGPDEIDWLAPEIEADLNSAIARLGETQSDTLGFLAAWGESIPLLLLADVNDDRRKTVDALVGKEFLRIEKEQVAFSSGNLRRLAYGHLPKPARRNHHRYWAEAAEKYLADDEGLPEILAAHLGRSGDPRAGYKANLIAARQLLGRGDLGKAGIYADSLLVLAQNGGGSIAIALMLSADIAKQAGDYLLARGRYIELLWQLRSTPTDTLRAETLKDLGDLYRSQKKPVKALAYIRRARRLFERLGNDQGVADCHNNTGLILWVGQEHERALESFFSALEFNERLGNFREQAKIYSNIGIIKDILGETSEVAGYFEAGHRNAGKAADPWIESLIANNLGFFFIRQNDLPRASRYLEEALHTSERIGYAENVINCLGNLGLCNLRAGDLFASIEYNQRAQRMAAEIGNRHLALDPESYLVEASILMGNFALAGRVLGGIERDSVYAENRTFARQVDLLRGRFERELGRGRCAIQLAAGAREYAVAVGDSRLALEAALLEARIGLDEGVPGAATKRLPEIAAEAAKLGHQDIADEAGLALARDHCGKGELAAVEAWLERLSARPGQTRRLLMEARNILGRLRAGRGRYDEAIAMLAENESEAISAGFLPMGMEAATELANVYRACLKERRAEEAMARADAYLQRITSSLPPGVTREDYLSRPTAAKTLKDSRGLSDRECVGNRGDRP